MSDTAIRPDVADPELDQEPPKHAHFCCAVEQMQAMVEGTPIEAICGFVWVPSGGKPENYPVCSRCAEIMAAIVAEHGRMKIPKPPCRCP